MKDELLEHHREYGAPQKRCSYTKREDGSVAIRSMDGADCLSDFSQLGFYVEPKEKPKLKTHWRK